MQGSNSRRIARLIGNLAVRPKYLPGYLQTNLLGKQPLDLELAWFSYAAIDFLQSFLQSQMSVFEYGSGGSTLFFARRVRTVISTEDNATWLENVRRRLAEVSLKNVTLQHHEFDCKNPEGFENSAYLHSIPPQKFDVIIVDGAEEAVSVRPICFYHAENFIKPGGIIVVDDSWRYPELRRNNRAAGHRIFQSVGPCRPGVTSTDIFFY
jgi:predicted O-methyltransferase YrrM